MFATSWQIVCHLNDIPNPGDYHTLDFLGEPLVAVRGQDDSVKAFFNVCRHRAARLLDGGSGHCPGRIVCPYHAWTYDLGGRLTAVPHRKEFADFTLDQYGLKPVETEIYKGFIFVRLKAGLPSVAEMLAPYESRIERLPARGTTAARSRHPAHAPCELEERDRQLFRCHAHHRGAPRSDAAVRPKLRRGSAALGGQDVGLPPRRPFLAAVRAFVPGRAASFAAPAGGTAAALDIFQAVAERGVRHLSRTRSISCK